MILLLLDLSLARAQVFAFRVWVNFEFRVTNHTSVLRGLNRLCTGWQVCKPQLYSPAVTEVCVCAEVRSHSRDLQCSCPQDSRALVFGHVRCGDSLLIGLLTFTRRQDLDVLLVLLHTHTHTQHVRWETRTTWWQDWDYEPKLAKQHYSHYRYSHVNMHWRVRIKHSLNDK